MLKWKYVQQVFQVSEWVLTSTAALPKIMQENRPEMVTVLSLDRQAEEGEEKAKIRYLGPFYMDWDCSSIEDAIVYTNLCLQKLKDMGVRMECINLYATGGRGFHAEIPMESFMLKIPVAGITYLPAVYKEMAFLLATEGLDLKIYSMGSGRMWRTPNIRRANGQFKVPITWAEMSEMTPELYTDLTSEPRYNVTWDAPEVSAEMMALFDKCQEKVKTRLSKLKAARPETVKRLAGKELPSLDAMLDGRGIKAGSGFQEISVQLAVTAVAFGWDVEKLVEKAQGLINNHEGDSSRYGTPKLKEKELRRMFNYMLDNPCYGFSAGAVKHLLNHPAMDLDGLNVDKADIEKQIEEGAILEAAGGGSSGEFDDLMGAVQLARTGIYIPSDEGSMKRICGVGFENVKILRSLGDEMQAGKDLGYVCDIYVGGQLVARQTIDADVFLSLQSFNKFLTRFSQVCYGGDTHVKGIMMSISDNARKAKRIAYVTGREGIDILRIPMHPDPNLRGDFMVWSDCHGVVVSPQHTFAEEINVEFSGYPDPRGMFQTDLSTTEDLATWLEDPRNKGEFREMMTDMLQYQSPSVVSKSIGWYLSCFFKPLFGEAYGKFPLLHIYGDAGAGKTETNMWLLRLFYNHQPPKEVTPGSTMFAMMQCLSGSASIPLLIDEYKPHEMGPLVHNRMKGIFRDGYNSKTIMRGGGSRDNPSYMQITATQVSAPIIFIGEGAETETAVMERVVAVNFRRPPKELYVAAKRRFERWTDKHHILSMLGRWMASEVLNNYSPAKLKDEFQPMYEAAMQAYMLPDNREGLTEEDLDKRSKVNDRSVYNYTVSYYGLLKLEGIMRDVFEAEYEGLFGETFKALKDGTYDGITALAAMTMPEWAKVINMLALMSNHAEPDPAWSLKLGQDYAVVDVGGQSRLELNARMCYIKYRTFCMRSNDRPLFAGDQSFITSLAGCPAFLERGTGGKITTAGGAIVLDIEQLSRLGIDNFRAK